MQTTRFVVFQLSNFLLFFFSGKYLICWSKRKWRPYMGLFGAHPLFLLFQLANSCNNQGGDHRLEINYCSLLVIASPASKQAETVFSAQCSHPRRGRFTTTRLDKLMRGAAVFSTISASTKKK